MALQNPPEQLCKRCVGGEKRVHILRLSRRNEREQTDPETSLGVLGAEIEARPPSGQRISPPPHTAPHSDQPLARHGGP